MLSCDAVVLETGTPVSGCSDRENSNADGFSKNLIRARCEGPVRDLGAVFAGRRLLRPDDLRTPGGAAVLFSVLGRPTGPDPPCAKFGNSEKRAPRSPVAHRNMLTTALIGPGARHRDWHPSPV